MAETSADIRAAIEGGWLGNTLAQPLSQTEADELIERSAKDPGAPLEPEVIARLAATKAEDPPGYERIIQRLKAAKVRVGVLEERIKRVDRSGREDQGQGKPVTFRAVEPWGNPVNGEELLDEIVTECQRYVVLSGASAIAVALWIVHSYCYSVFEHTPRLAITSPEKRCGKTTLLSVMLNLVCRPLAASGITAAAMFRTIEKYKPTLLIDEADTFIKDNEEIRGVINAGHRRGGEIIRLVGDEHEPRSFSTFCPAAIAAIGSLPGTIEDRSVIVSMRRRDCTEQVERFRSDRVDHMHDLARKVARWVEDNVAVLSSADPDMPDGLQDRACDNWTALLAIADRVGGEWPAKARQAALELATQGEENAEQAPGLLLLQDVRSIFETRVMKRLPDADRVSSTDLLRSLIELDDRPWRTWSRGSTITSSAVAKLLKPYGIRPNTIKLVNKSQPNGYKRSQFEDAFKRYLPAPPSTGAQASPASPTQGNLPGTGLSDTSPPNIRGEGEREAESGENPGLGEGGEHNRSAALGKRTVEPDISEWANTWLVEDLTTTPGDIGPVPEYVLAMATRLPSQERSLQP